MGIYTESDAMSFYSFLKLMAYRIFTPGALLRRKYGAFKSLLEFDRVAHREMAVLEGFYHNGEAVDFCAVKKSCRRLTHAVSKMIENLIVMAPRTYNILQEIFLSISSNICDLLTVDQKAASPPFALTYQEIGPEDAEKVGGKAAHLAVIHRELGIPVPRGFAVTSSAFHYFCDFNNLGPTILDALADLDIHSPSSLEATSRELVSRFMNASVPPEIEEILLKGYDDLFQTEDHAPTVSMRSSAVGEDAALSFAGQYRTVLNVTREQLCSAYKKVIASKYSPMALYYRIRNGLLDQETPMAVLVLEMVDVEAGGILYSADPLSSVSETVRIYSIWGLGELLVKGIVAPDLLEVSREGDFPLLNSRQASKEFKAVLHVEKGIETVSLDEGERGRLSLDEESARQLARWGVQLEAHFGSPQDVEWCKDRKGNLYILQSRPLGMEQSLQESRKKKETAVPNAVLLAAGEKASAGVGAGKVVKTTSKMDLKDIPRGAVLVAPVTSPKFTQIIERLSAVVTDVGSIAGHFASVAREWGIPLLVNTEIATQVLKDGETVTVDADGGRVYAGVAQDLLPLTCDLRGSPQETPFRRRLRRVLDWISPLNLTDPQNENFSPEHCKTVHDALRFIHEKAVEEMFSIGADRHQRSVRGAKKLLTDIPIAVYVLDLGEGLHPSAHFKKKVALQDIANRPLKALWRGLSHPSIEWASGLRHLDWQEFDRVSGGIFSMESQFLSSFALIARDYLNMNIRFGYHFVVLDTLCGLNPRENYVSLHFEGGGGDYEGRTLRVLFLSRVLEHYGFEVHPEGDMITAQVKKLSSEESEVFLEMAGRMFGFTRLLDIRLKGREEVEELVDEFLSNGVRPVESHP
ncbi:pyruvate phosphate dikinase PEP/pyruvate binding subunit [Desulforhabdus amnigena]|uniref:Phosphoenolpyruvate synthase n=2 Tax=Desulforhabdus amnigena TaxID=40218 RepID=A0A9W6FX34_9BACT|nr:pyruvate phosphate dikinase PEP/pyruvate binding subunit [Desulforhabdus amnigena]